MRDILLARQAREKGFEEEHDVFVAVLVAVDFSDSAAVANKPGFVWFQELIPGDPTPGIAFNRKSPPLPNTKVTIKRWPKKPFDFEVLDWDPTQIINLPGYTGTPLLPQHGRDHEPGGYDPLNVYAEMMVMLRTDPGGGLTVNVGLYRYSVDGTAKVFDGYNGYDLSVYVPAAGLARYVLVYLDSTTNALAIASGDTSVDLDTEEPTRPDLPGGAIASSYVRLAGEQTTIERTDIKPGREWLRINDYVDAHASTHIKDGSDEIDGDKLDIDFTPSNYTPSTSPAEADDVDHLTAHLAGIDDAISGGWPDDDKAMIGTTEYDSISAAITAASAGDTIKVGPGTFTEQVDVSKNLNIICSGREATIITNTANPTLEITSGANLYLYGCTIKNTGSLGSDSDMIALYLTSGGVVTIENCDLIADLNGSGSGRSLKQMVADATTLIDCRLTCDNADGSSTDNAAISSADGTIDVYGCELDGQVDAVQTYLSGTVVILHPGTQIVAGALTENSSSEIKGWYEDSSGNIKAADADDGNDIFLDDESTVGVFTRARNRFVGLPLLTHFRNSTGLSGTSFAGSPFESSPTTGYWDDSYYYISSSTTAGAFEYKAPVASWKGKEIVARVGVQSGATYAGIRCDDGTDNNYVMWLLDTQTTARTLLLRQVFRTGGGSSFVTTYTSYYPVSELVPLLLRIIDLGSGTWRADYWIAGEAPTPLGFILSNGSTMAWTISRVGLFVAKTGGTSRVGLFDWVAADLIT